MHTQRFEKCVERTVLYGNITPKTPNGTFRVLFGRSDVLFIHIPVVITKYICDVVIGIDDPVFPSIIKTMTYSCS